MRLGPTVSFRIHAPSRVNINGSTKKTAMASAIGMARRAVKNSAVVTMIRVARIRCSPISWRLGKCRTARNAAIGNSRLDCTMNRAAVTCATGISCGTSLANTSIQGASAAPAAISKTPVRGEAARFINSWVRSRPTRQVKFLCTLPTCLRPFGAWFRYRHLGAQGACRHRVGPVMQQTQL